MTTNFNIINDEKKLKKNEDKSKRKRTRKNKYYTVSCKSRMYCTKWYRTIFEYIQLCDREVLNLMPFNANSVPKILIIPNYTIQGNVIMTKQISY